MKRSLLPEYLDFEQKAKKGLEIAGSWPVNRLDRLSDMLVDDHGDIHAELTFGQEDRVLFVSGKVKATLKVTCQRCMNPMDLPLETDFRLALVHDESRVDRLPEAFEPLLLEDEAMSVPNLLEDELLLAMPLVPVHEVDCSDYLRQQKVRQQVDKVQQAEEKDKKNPFAVLKDLL